VSSEGVARLPAILLLLAAALCSHQASTRGWGDAAGPDGTRYRLAPNGLTHLAGDGSALAACRWFPLRGTDPLCQAAAGAESPFQRLTYAYPALQSGAWLSFLAMLVLTLAGPAAAKLCRGLATLATVATLLGVWLVLGHISAPAALVALPFGFGGAGLVLAAIAPAASIAGGLLIPAAPPRAP
jgi:hypothetical protein